jgi:hypothetical protein
MSSRLTESFLRHVTQCSLSSDLSKQLAQYVPNPPAHKGSLESLLQWTEGLIRQRPQEATAFITEALALLQKHGAHHPDTHYLDFLWQLFQQAPTPMLIQRLQAALALPQRKGNPAYLWRALAEQYLKGHQLKEATAALLQAFQTAFTAETLPHFTHCTTALPHSLVLSREALHFDLDVFDALYPWDPTPACEVRFDAVDVDQHGQVYVLETHHRWLFCFNAQGQFVYGLREHDLADRAFLHPESLFQLHDISTSDDHLYVAGCQGKIYVYTLQGQPVRHLLPPPGVGDPLSLAALPDGQLFVVYQHSAQIHFFNTQGVYQGAFGSNTTLKQLNKSYFCGVAARDQEVYLYDRQWVQAFEIPDAASVSSSAPVAHWAAPSDSELPRCWNGVSVDQGRLWVADTLQHQVVTAPVSHTPSLRAKTPGLIPLKVAGLRLQAPNDLAADGHGGVYIANTGLANVLHLSAQKKIRVLIEHPRFCADMASLSSSHQSTDPSTQRKKVTS